jgi:hypothetical protein
MLFIFPYYSIRVTVSDVKRINTFFKNVNENYLVVVFTGGWQGLEPAPKCDDRY